MMTDYIQAVQKAFVEQLGFPANAKGLPANVPDGHYDVTIDGKVDHIKIINGKINCLVGSHHVNYYETVYEPAVKKLTEDNNKLSALLEAPRPRAKDWRDAVEGLVRSIAEFNEEG